MPASTLLIGLKSGLQGKRMYLGTIEYDFSRSINSNSATELKVALTQLGWTKCETTAFRIETADISLIYQGVVLVMKQAQDIGELSALTYHIQLFDPRQNVIRGSRNHPYALQYVAGKQMPF